MIAVSEYSARPKGPDSWQEGYLEMLPSIRHHAQMALRDLALEERSEAIQEVTVSAMIAYRRLAELGKTDIAYPTALARYAVARYRVGRRVSSRLNCHDVMSPYAQRKNQIRIGRLWQRSSVAGDWQEMLVEDKNAGPADVAGYPIDFAAWLASLTPRQRGIGKMLA